MADQPTITDGLGVSIPPPARPVPTRTRPKVREGKRIFRGYAVLDQAGTLIWGTFRPNEADAARAFERWNPTPAGFSMGESVRPVTIIIDPAKPPRSS